MKKTILLSLFVLAIVSFSYAQTFKIIEPFDNNSLNDSTVVIYGNPNTQLTSTFYVINTSAKKDTVKATRNVISALAGTTNEICWVQCYSPSTSTAPSHVILAPGDTAKLANQFNGDYFPTGMIGSTTIRYMFYDSTNHSDSAWVEVQYISNTAGIASVSGQAIDFSAPYPNPANNSVSFNYGLTGGVQTASLKIFNLLGECVQTLPLNTSKNKTKINVQDMPSGIYVCEVEASGCQPAYQKLIVSH